MHEELYADAIGEITVSGTVVRIDLVSLSPSERDMAGQPKQVFRQRIIMPVEGFANAAELMQKALNGLIEGGAVTRSADKGQPHAAAAAKPSVGQPHPKHSPNFA